MSFEIHFLDKTKTLHARKARKLRTTRGDWRHKLCRRKVSRSLEFEVPSLWVLWSCSFKDVFLNLFSSKKVRCRESTFPHSPGKRTASRFLQIHLLYMLPCILHEKVFALLVSTRARIDDTTLRWSLDLICLRGDWFYQCCANVEQFCREHVAISNNESLPIPSMWQRNRFLECFLRYSWWSPQWLPCEINVRKKLLIDRFSTLARNHFNNIVEFWISELPKHHETFRNLKRVPCFGQAQTQQIQQANVSDLPCFRCSSRIPETWPNLEAFTDDGSPANLSSTFNHSAIVL